MMMFSRRVIPQHLSKLAQQQPRLAASSTFNMQQMVCSYIVNRSNTDDDEVVREVDPH